MNHEGATMMPGMIDLQTARVADHRAGLAREAAALRAERARDHVRDHAVLRTDPLDHRAELAPRRVRIGRWLITFGEAVAGSRAASADAPRPVTESPMRFGEAPDDRNDRWASAA